jgi:hypothetical protein
MPPSDPQVTQPVATTSEVSAIDPAIPELRLDLLPQIGLTIGAGFAGRRYFGGLGGALLGVAIFKVFLSPIIFNKKAS